MQWVGLKIEKRNMEEWSAVGFRFMRRLAGKIGGKRGENSDIIVDDRGPST